MSRQADFRDSRSSHVSDDSTHHRGVVCDFGRDTVGGEGGWAAGVVDDVADLALVVESYGDHVVKADVGIERDLDGSGEGDVRMAEDAVDAEAPGFVPGDAVGDFVGGPAVGAGSAGVAGLVGRIVGDLGLVEVGAAGVAVPEDLELLVMFDEEAVDGDVVGVDDETVGAGVAGPSRRRLRGRLARSRCDRRWCRWLLISRLTTARPTPAPPTRKNTSWREMGFLCVADFAFLPGRSAEGRAIACGTGVEEQAGDDDAVSVCGGHGGGAVDGTQRGEAKAKDYGVGVSDVDGFCQIVDAGREDEIFALRELGVDGGGVVSIGVGDVKLRDRDGFSGGDAGVPGDAGAVGARGRGRGRCSCRWSRPGGMVFRGRWESCAIFV